MNAREIAEKIADDIQDRKGLGNEWDLIDEDIRDEIIGEWEQIIEDGLAS